MNRERLIDFSRGDDLGHFWKCYERRRRARCALIRSFWTFRMSRAAALRGGYVGAGAEFGGVPSLPHGLHGVFISRFAVIGRDCRIYQNVTIGEVDRLAPHIGDRCLIGAGAVLVGGIRVGDDVRIGAGCVVFQDIPDGCTVVSQPPRILEREREGGNG